MPHDRSALSDQLGALLTQQRFNSVVVHNYCRSAEHFLEYLAQRDIAVGAATPEHVSRPRWPELPPASRSSASAAGGNPFLVRESMSYCAWCRNDGRRSHRLRARLKPCADRYATSTRSGCMCNAVSRKCPSARSSGGRHFLSSYTARGAVDELAELNIRDIDIYFEMRAAGPRRRSLKDVAERLRSLMRFLHRTGRIRVDLAPGIIGPVLYAYESGEPGLLDDPARAAQACGNPNGGRPNRGSSSSLKQK